MSDDQTKSTSNRVKAQGCVRAGVESGCLVLKDINDGKEYELIFTGPKPAVGTAISFEGVIHSGPTICQQGTPVDVAAWTQIRLPCEDTK